MERAVPSFRRTNSDHWMKPIPPLKHLQAARSRRRQLIGLFWSAISPLVVVGFTLLLLCGGTSSATLHRLRLLLTGGVAGRMGALVVAVRCQSSLFFVASGAGDVHSFGVQHGSRCEACGDPEITAPNNVLSRLPRNYGLVQHRRGNKAKIEPNVCNMSTRCACHSPEKA